MTSKEKKEISDEEKQVRWEQSTFETLIENRGRKKMVTIRCMRGHRYEFELPTKTEVEKGYGSNATRSKETFRPMNGYFIFRTYFSKVTPQFNRNEKSSITSEIWRWADENVKEEFRQLDNHLKADFNHKKFLHYSPYLPDETVNKKNVRPKSPKPKPPRGTSPVSQIQSTDYLNKSDQHISDNLTAQTLSNIPKALPLIKIHNEYGMPFFQPNTEHYQVPDDTAVSIPERNANSNADNPIHSNFSSFSSSHSLANSLGNSQMIHYRDSSSPLLSSTFSSPVLNCSPLLSAGDLSNFNNSPIFPLFGNLSIDEVRNFYPTINGNTDNNNVYPIDEVIVDENLYHINENIVDENIPSEDLLFYISNEGGSFEHSNRNFDNI